MCPLCKKSAAKTSSETQVVGIKGTAIISATAQTIGDTVTEVNVGDIIHRTCRSDNISKRNINKKLSLSSKPQIKSRSRKRVLPSEIKTCDH